MAAPVIAPRTVDEIGYARPGLQIITLGAFTLSTTPQQIDFTTPTLNGQLGALQSVYVNNWYNSDIVYLRASRTGQIVLVPPYSAGWYPIAVPVPAVIEIFASGNASVSVDVCSALIVQGPSFNTRALEGDAGTLVNVAISGAAGTFVLAPATPGLRARLWRAMLSLTVAGNITFQDSATVALSGAMPALASTPLILPSTAEPIFQTVAGVGIDVVTTQPVRGFAQYTLE